MGTGFANLGDGMLQLTLPLMTLGVTRDPAAFALVGVAMRVPWLVFALPAGVLVDRVDRRKAMISVNVGRVVAIGGLAIAVGLAAESLWILCALGFALGLAETLYDTAAQSIVPRLVGTAELSWANGRVYAVELIAQKFAGPPLAGLVVGVSVAWAVAGSAAAYAVSAVVLALVAGVFRPVRTPEGPHLVSGIAEGVRFLYRDAVLRSLALSAGAANLLSSACLAVLPLYAVAPGMLSLKEFDFGILLTAEAVGALGGALVADRVLRRTGGTGALLVAWVLLAASMAGRPLGDSPVVVGVSLAVEGGAFVLWNVVTVSLRQRVVPDELLGRVNSGYRLVAWGAMPVGALLGGVVGRWLGVPSVFVLAGATMAFLLPFAVRGVGE